MFWEIAQGFSPDVGGLTPATLDALNRFASRVRALGGRLLVTSAYRPGDPRLHGKGKAVDVWVPGWEHKRIAEAAAGTGFVAGYIPRDANFVELAIAEHWYSVPGEKFVLPQKTGRTPDWLPLAEHMPLPEVREAPDWLPAAEHFPILHPLKRELEDMIPENPFVRWGVIGVVVLLIVLMLVIFVKSL